MRVRSILVGLAFVAAVAATSALGSMAASSAYAAGAGAATIVQPIPTFVPGFENPLVPQPMQTPILGR
jgi:hypothetical protein